MTSTWKTKGKTRTFTLRWSSPAISKAMCLRTAI